MKILMMTNTYKPFVGGVERSVETFTEEYRKNGHDVMIVAPTFEHMPEDEYGVIRVPAIQNFNGTDFSVRLPVPGILSTALTDFRPDIVHSHHPYLIGDTALRVATKFQVPLVFTHHTFYERYTHYVPGDSPALKRFTVALSTGYANLADYVFAPSESVAGELQKRGVVRPVAVIPTGIDYGRFMNGNGLSCRTDAGISAKDFVIGFVSRIAPEKNIVFLSRAVTAFLKKQARAHFFLIGSGPSQGRVRQIFEEEGVRNRLHVFGTLAGQDLIDAYHAMDVFAFASQTETQGLVLAEAMAAGIPVVAIDAPGVREVVDDFSNGRLLKPGDLEGFSRALGWIAAASGYVREELERNARRKAGQYTKELCSKRALEIYASLVRKKHARQGYEEGPWDKARRRIKAEWDMVANIARATGAVLESHDEGDDTESAKSKE